MKTFEQEVREVLENQAGIDGKPRISIDQALNRVKEKEYYQRYYSKHINKIRKLNREYKRIQRQKNPAKAKIIDAQKRLKKRDKQKIMNKIQWAIESGKLKKPNFCRCCGRHRKLQAHHSDYSKPLKIIWLCSNCHGFLHSYFSKLQLLMKVDEGKLRKIILNLKAIKFACLSSAQEDTHDAIITMDLVAQNNLTQAIEILENIMS